MLRHRADIRTVLYLLVTAGLLFWQWNRETFSVWLFLWACFMAISCSIIAHNHNHLNIWKNKTLNRLTDYWITLFYGFPTFAWIPTHNQNHHKFNNRWGDDTVTYRYSEKNNLLTLLTYPTVSGIHQQKPIREYLKTNWRNNRKRFWFSVSQYLVLGAFIGTALLLDWKKALLFVIIPQQIALFVVLIFNYMQHVHADEESKYDHSRNITGFWLNALLFNNGYHTVHHDRPGLHWSKTKAAHKEVEHLINPVLNEPSMWWMFFRMFVLGTFSDRFRSKSLRLARIEREKAAETATAAESPEPTSLAAA